MSWYNTSGPCQNYVLFSKVKYTRNVSKYNFCHLLDQKRAEELTSRLDSLLTGNGFRGERILSGVNHSLLSLAEKQLAERDFVFSDKPRALYLNEPCNLTVAVGGKELINISSLFAGLATDEARNMSMGVEVLIDRELTFAYLEGVGYLSSEPERCGSGVLFSAMLYLPSLGMSGGISAPPLRIPKDMSLIPFFADGENSGSLYILSYIPHYLSNEEDAAHYFSKCVSALCDRERIKDEILYKNNADTLQNDAMRALGALLCSNRISEKELFSYLSAIRICRCAANDSSSPFPTVADLNYLSAEGLNSSVIISSKEICTSQSDCDRARAKLVRTYIEHKKEVSNVK